MSDARDYEETFRRLYAEHFDAVLGYALRRVEESEDAVDVVAETFLVAWRRLSQVPRSEEARPWLYGVARRVLANQRRGEGRRRQLGERLRHQLATAVPDCGEEVAQREDVARAMRALSERDREVMQLHLWEGLEPRDIAKVLGDSAAAVRPRLSRARTRLRELLGNGSGASGHFPARTSLATRRKES